MAESTPKQNSMKKTNIALVSLALLAAPLANAQWQAVKTFENGSLSGVAAGFSPAEDNMNGGLSIIPDPTDATNQGVLQIDPGVFTNGTDTHNVWAVINMPDITGTATVYSRQMRGELVDIVWGTAPSAEGEPSSYGNFSSALRWELDGIFDYREGSEGYREIDGASSTEMVWYESWLVVDVATNTYDAFIKGGTEFPEVTQVVNDAAFRNQSTDPQNRFYARITTGAIDNPKAVDKVWFDDIFVDLSGMNITTPGTDVEEPDPGEVPTENGSGELSNLSTRGSVATGENAMFVGFVATDDSRRFLLRGAGPLLAGFGVTNALANPVITVRNSDQEVVATNTNWGDNSNSASIALTAASVGAQPFADGSADAALMLFLPPGVYTMEVASGDGSTGVALAEVYRIP